MENILEHTEINKKEVYDFDLIADLNATLVIPELLHDYVVKAKQELNEALLERELYINETVFNDLLGWYKRILARSTNSLFTQRYTSYFLTIYPFWRPELSKPGNCRKGTSREKLNTYIDWEKEEGIFSENETYPELFRLINVFRANWLTATLEMLERIEMHKTVISKELLSGSITLASLTGTTFGISDPHHNGQTAAILHFGIDKIVYKPRSLDGEYGWNLLIESLCKNGLPYELYLPKIVRYQGYGFMEFIDTTPIESKNQVESCYEKYGAIMAIAHAFGTYDLHHENIIVGKHGPVVIDAETLFRCVLEHSEQGENRLKLDKSISLEDIDSKESVMDIGMLPHSLLSKLNEDEDLYEDYLVGALFPFGIHKMKEFVPCGIGSDNLQMEQVNIRCSKFSNLPYYKNVPELPINYIDEIQNGFKNVHTFLLNNRKRLLTEECILEKLHGLDLRLLIRPTMQYGIIYFRSISPQLLASKEHRTQKIKEDLKLLSKLRLDNIDKVEIHEINSILNGDIPRFEMKSNGVNAYETPLMFSPVQLAKERFERLNELDLNLQLITIREKLVDRTKLVAESKNKGIESDQQSKHAFEIIQSIVDTTGYNKKDDPFWTYTAYAPGYGSTMVHSDREAFYDGALGTAVAIAEAGKLSNNSNWLQLSKEVLAPILRGEKPECIERGAGMARGLGGLLYAMIRIYDCTKDETILDKAIDLAVKYSKYVIEIDPLDEVLHGKSGLLLALVALYKRKSNNSIRIIMDNIANLLISSSITLEKGVCWKVLDGHSLPNMSHGTSGIAMALARWYEISKDVNAHKVILETLRYDNSFWDEDENGWIDARVADVPNEESSTWTWCNGRSGGLLARLAIYKSLGLSIENDPFVIKALKAKMGDIFNQASPGLCCGSAGLVDALTMLYQELPIKEIETYKNAAIKLISLESPKSHYCNLTAALFTGTSGLAFSLLRAAFPDKIKSILWFE